MKNCPLFHEKKMANIRYAFNANTLKTLCTVNIYNHEMPRQQTRSLNFLLFNADKMMQILDLFGESNG